LKGIWVLAVVCAFVAGSFVTGASVYAQEERGGSFLCPVGQALTVVEFLENNKILNFICQTTIPDTYIKTASDYASNDNNASVTLGCDEGDVFLSGSGHALPRDDATPMEIFINEPQVNAAGEIEWHATARYPDSSGGRDLVVSVICLNTSP